MSAPAFAAIGLRLRVINAGVAAYKLAQELAYLHFEIVDYSPALVLVVDGYNDLSTSFSAKPSSAASAEITYHWLESHLDNASLLDQEGKPHFHLPALG